MHCFFGMIYILKLFCSAAYNWISISGFKNSIPWIFMEQILFSRLSILFASGLWATGTSSEGDKHDPWHYGACNLNAKEKKIHPARISNSAKDEKKTKTGSQIYLKKCHLAKIVLHIFSLVILDNREDRDMGIYTSLCLTAWLLQGYREETPLVSRKFASKGR